MGKGKRSVVLVCVLLLLLLVGMWVWRGGMLALGAGRASQSLPTGGVRYGQPYIPENIAFAGERVPLEAQDVREALEWEMCVISNWHSQVLLILKRMPRYFAEIEPILRLHNVPDDFKYLAVVESNLYDRSYSSAHAAGIWQFLEATAREYGLEVNGNVDERYNLQLSTHAACRYLKAGYDRFGSWTMSAASYNMGMNGLQRQSDMQGMRNYYDLFVGVETGRYVFRLIAFKLILEHPDRYGFHLSRSERYPLLNSKHIVVDTTVANLAEFAKSHGANYKTLKWLNPWLRSNELPVVDGKQYTVEIVDSVFRQAGRYQ